LWIESSHPESLDEYTFYDPHSQRLYLELANSTGITSISMGARSLSEAW
jgi:hypothetical protein